MYYPVGQELGLDWDFNDPEVTHALARRFSKFVSDLDEKRFSFSGAALACANKSMAEHLLANMELEQTIARLRSLSVTIRSAEDDAREAADMLEAAADVQDFQSKHRISMRICSACKNGNATRELASELRDLADAIASI